MTQDIIEKKIEHLEDKMKSIEENVAFLKELLSHIHSQFQDFRKDIETRIKE